MPNIVIQGDTLNNVPAFNFKDTGNHTVTFYYTGDADAVRGDVANGKVFYTANGKTTGTYIPTSYDIEPATVTVTSSYTPTDPELTCTPPYNYIFGANEFGLDGMETLRVDLSIEGNHSVSSAAYDWSGGQDTVISANSGAGYIAMVNAHLVKPLNLEPGNIKNGVVIGGITGTYNPSSSVTYTVTNATEGDVLSGKSFYKATSTTTATLSVGTYTPPTGGFNIDLTGTTWVFNNQVDGVNIYHSFQINFTDGNSHSWSYLATNYDSKTENIYYMDGKDDTVVYEPLNGWVSTGYKTISITGGTDASNPALVAWLLTNATKQ